MFRKPCTKCIDIYEKGLRSEPQFKESLKKLTSKEKSFINNRIRDRRKIIHKQFTDIFRDEAGTMLSVIENVANKKRMNRMAQQVHLRNEQQLMNTWEKTRLLQKKTRRNEAAKKIQKMFKKTRKSRKKRSPKMSTKLDRYQRNMLDVLDANKSIEISPEEREFQNDFFDISLDDTPPLYESLSYKPNFKRLTAKEKMAAAERNLKAHRSYLDKKKSKLTAKEKKAGIKEIARRMEEGKAPYRYSTPGSNTSGDFESPTKKKSWFGNLFTSKKKGGKRTRKRRKRKRTRKKRKTRRKGKKRRRRKTRRKR